MTWGASPWAARPWADGPAAAAAAGFKAAWALSRNRLIGAGMYPRNAASPPRLAIGPVVQISDGAVQTSGVTVRVLEQGGAEGDGGGTTAYSTDGVVLYTPLQAETDTAQFILIAKKTGCIPANITVPTSASAVAGYAGLDWSVINAPTTTVGLTGTTIATSQVVASVSGAVGSVTGLTASNLDAAISTRMATYTQPTGFLAATFPGTVASTTNITAASGCTLAAVTHTGAVIPTVTTVTGLTASDVAAIKAKTDSLTFTSAGFVDANVQKINDVTITGNGGTGTEFGV